MFEKLKKSDKLDVNSLNSLINIGKKVLNILFVLLIILMIYVISRLVSDLKVIHIFKTIFKILIPFFLGLAIAWLLDPIVSFFERKGWKRSLSTFVVFFLFLLLIVLFFVLVIPSLGKQIQDAIGMVPGVVNSFNKWIEEFFGNLANIYNFDFTSIKENIYNGIANYTNAVTEDIPNFVIKVFSKLLSGGVTFVISLFIAFYMLFDFKNVRKTLTSFMPKKLHNTFMDLTDRLNDSLKNYVLGTLFVTAILFGFQSLGFVIAGLKASLVFGLICAVTNIIPYIGPYIGGIPAVLVGYTISPLVGTLTLISVVISQFLESYILTPLILSKTMKLHPVTIIIGLLVFEYFFGIIGMLISTPVISCLKIIFNFIDEKYDIFDKIQG